MEDCDLKEISMTLTAWSYATYVSVSVCLTVWVATTLARNGRIFLVDTFRGNEPLADSVNRLLVVGSYLINVGYILLAIKYGDKPANLEESIEFCATKIGLVLVVLGGMHFFNLYVFSRMRRRALLRNAPPPVHPQERLAPQGGQA
jgi:hypothetical protein